MRRYALVPFVLAALAAFPCAVPSALRAQEAPNAAETGAASPESAEDPFLWLEDVTGEKALAWVERQNERSLGELTKHPEFEPIRTATLEILESDDRIVFASRHGDHVYDHWKDAEHPRGVYRRATLSSYLAGEPEWDVILDVDALAAEEGVSWVWKGISLRRPDFTRGLVRLSVGGSDAVVIRELDLPSKSFVEDGFRLPEAKGSLEWIDPDTVFVDTNFGPGSLTDSGYPRLVKRWRRGTPLDEAEIVFEGRQESVSVGAHREHYGDEHLDWLYHGTTFFTRDRYLLDGASSFFVDVPSTARVHTYLDGALIFSLYHDWEVDGVTYAGGTVMAASLAALREGRKELSVVFAPGESVAVQTVDRTRSYLIVRVLDDVRDRLLRFHLADGKWVSTEIPFEGLGTIWTSNVDPDHETFFASHSSFLRPTTLFLVDAKTLEKRAIDSAPERFDPAPYESQQHFVTSKDGTRVPYFVVLRKDAKLDGSHATLLYGYGGFKISLRPRYLGAIGRSWLERGGVYVLANIRGGGEYGPRWHQSALLENRPRAYEDFEAIAEDLIARKVTSPERLGIRGGSNGGLLVGAAFTRRPDLYGAVVCQVPLLDMRRYDKLLAGASWVAEYGDPDVPEQWEYIEGYSPYHNLAKDAEYPRVLFTTSTRDDRVHPAHARKMVARMERMGHPVLYYENTEGGHSGAADARQRAFTEALVYTYLLTELADDS